MKKIVISILTLLCTLNVYAQRKDFPETNNRFLECNGKIPFQISLNSYGGATLILKGTEYLLFSGPERYLDNDGNRYIHYSGIAVDIFVQTWLPGVNRTKVSNSIQGVLNTLTEGNCY